MSDDLKNSLKQLESYVQEESKQKKKAQAKFERELKISAYRQFKFPLNKIIFVSTIFSISFFMFGQKLLPLVTKYAPQQVADQYAAVLKQTDDFLGKVDDLKNNNSNKKLERTFEASKFETPTPTTEADRDVAVQTAKPNEPQWVQIDRKWYKKTPDNIYYINGKKILFIENRQRQMPKSADAASTAAPTEKNN